MSRGTCDVAKGMKEGDFWEAFEEQLRSGWWLAREGVQAVGLGDRDSLLTLRS